MEQLETLKRQIESAGALQSLVKIMKTLAAVRVREYGQIASYLEQYDRTIEMGLEVVMKNKPGQVTLETPSFKRPGAIILGSDQGLSGRFNEIISNYAIEKLNELKVRKGDRAILVVGGRLVPNLEKSGWDAWDVLSFQGDLFGVGEVIPKVLLQIEKWNYEGEVDSVTLFYNKPESEVSFHPQMQHLFPVNPKWLLSLVDREWPCRAIPCFTMDWHNLFSALIKQYLFFSLQRTFLESLASENISRLIAMQVAEDNIEERLDEFSVRYNRIRQVGITSELLDIVTGYEALEGKDKGTMSSLF